MVREGKDGSCVGGIGEREGSPAGAGHCRPGVELEEKRGGG